DTARVYTDSERKVGAALAECPDPPVLVSKTYERGAEGARNDVDITLENLGVETIDVYLLHNVNSVALLDSILSPGGALEGLQAARDEGVIGHIGISSHKPEVLEEALAREAFEVIEAPFNAIEQQMLSVLEDARRRQVGSIIMKPLAGGALQNGDLALRFILEHPVDCVIPGMQRIEEVEENFSIEGPLSDAERDTLLAEAHEWQGRFCRRCEYCLSACPEEINITGILLFATYSQRYGLTDWAQRRYSEMDIHADACRDCAKCEERCPYDLPIGEMLKEAHEELTR
ncbi:MAG: aldo/keto reductase, partial [Planctomycetes bacterium]|nr:aldo/keto reductase [Planctomycetota bacterium]